MMQNSVMQATVGADNTATEETIGERQLWTAVLVHAVEEWRRGGLRVRRLAHQFLFENHEDFSFVCACAGLEPESLRAQLLKVGNRLEPHVRFVHPQAA